MNGNLFSMLLMVIVLMYSSCVQSGSQQERAVFGSAAIKDTCDNPDAHINCCFRNMPEHLSSKMVIAREDEPGERLVLTGMVLKSDSITPFPGVIIYAYHTDNNGYYSKKGNESGFQKWHGYLHGWCMTDGAGEYEIQTIRPARYPVNLFPAHIHAALKKPDGTTPFFISDFVFSDDSLVNGEYLSTLHGLPGGRGIINLQRQNNGVWTGRRDIVLP